MSNSAGQSEAAVEPKTRPPISDTVRFIKYCVVGGSSMLLGMATFDCAWLFRHNFPADTALANITSIVYNFLVNRSWTFSDKRGQTFGVQAVRFVLVSVVGWGINTILVATIVCDFGIDAGSGHFDHKVVGVLHDLLSGRSKHLYSLTLLNLAGIAAAVIVAAWNFIGHRHWSFGK